MTRQPLRITAALLAIGTVLAACASPSGSGEPFEPADIEGVWGDDSAANTPYLDFTADEEVLGSDGCNTLHGTYTLADDAVNIELGLSTLRGCVGVDTWLRHVARVQPDGDTLSVYDHSGELIGTLDRADS